MLVQLFLWEDCPLILAVGLPSHYLHWDGWLSDHGVLQVEISRGYDCETNQMILVSIAVLTMKIWTNTAAITCKRKTNVQTCANMTNAVATARPFAATWKAFGTLIWSFHHERLPLLTAGELAGRFSKVSLVVSYGDWLSNSTNFPLFPPNPTNWFAQIAAINAL